jgi:hypothetical protein
MSSELLVDFTVLALTFTQVRLSVIFMYALEHLMQLLLTLAYWIC